MKVLGIDPGLANTGWAVIEYLPNGEIKCLNGGTIITRSGQPEGKRLEFIITRIEQAILQFQPCLGAYEKTYFNKPSMEKVYKTTGAIMVLFHKAGIEFEGYQPQVIKQGITGNRSANKDQIKRCVESIIRARLDKCSEHQIDAVAVAITAGNIKSFSKAIGGV